MSLNGLTTEEVAGALSHLLEAPGLQISDRNKRFLRYVVEETLAGRGDRIKSYAIAVDVFGRGPISTARPIRSSAPKRRACAAP